MFSITTIALHTKYPVSTGVSLHAQKQGSVLLCKDHAPGLFFFSPHTKEFNELQTPL